MSLNRVRSEQTDLLMQAMLEIKNVDEGYVRVKLIEGMRTDEI